MSSHPQKYVDTSILTNTKAFLYYYSSAKSFLIYNLRVTEACYEGFV